MLKLLNGIKVIELGGAGPAPMCGYILQDFGASVTRITNRNAPIIDNFLSTHKTNIPMNLKDPKDQGVIKKLILESDILIDPMRPGKLEKYDMAPEELLKENKRLIIARISGYGQPKTEEENLDKCRPGHDINYLAESGALWFLLPNQPNEEEILIPPLFLGDMAGGALPTAFGIALSLFERERTGKGCVIDTSITNGLLYTTSLLHASRQVAHNEYKESIKKYGLALPKSGMTMWPNLEVNGKNFLDGGAPFYRAYKTKDDKYIVVGAIEPETYEKFVKCIDLPLKAVPQMDRESWPRAANLIGSIILTKTRDEWLAYKNGKMVSEAAVSPVLSPGELLRIPKDFWRFCTEEDVKYPNPQPNISSAS